MKPHRIAACSLLATLAACATVESPPVPPTTLPEVRPGYVAGYLQPAQLPDSLVLLPGPPVAGSPGQAADDAFHKSTRNLRDTPRWELAKSDADLRFPHAAGIFQCALGVTVSEEGTPHLNMLLRRVRMDASRATDKAKQTHKRERPYMVTSDAPCETARASPDSYPSGHSSIGWAWALTLAELVPERADAILARGVEYGQSRVICGVHWQSDVEAGRVIGAATVSRLHADPVYLAQMAHARKEIEQQRARGLGSPRDCAAARPAG